jgi:O-antigen ligase
MEETALGTWWESRLVRRLESLCALVVVGFLCRVATEEGLAWIGWVIAGVVVVLLTATHWPYGATVVLIGMSAMPRFFVEIFGWKARPEHFAAIIITVAVGVWFSLGKDPARLHTLDYFVFAYVFCNFVSSAFASSAPSSTLRWALQNSLAVSSYFLIRWLVRDLKLLRFAFGVLLTVGVIESVYGIFCYASQQLFGTSFGVEIGAYLVDVPGTYGSLYEPNLFGAFTACCAILFLSLYLFRGHDLRVLICFLITSTAAVLSFSRAALLALVITVGYVFWKSVRRKNESGNKVAVLALLLVLVLLIVVGSRGGVIRERFTDLFYEGLTEQTAISRAIVAEQALQEIPGHLLFGSGTASFNLSFDWAQYVPDWAGEKTWIGNAPLRILHDTGLFGLTVFLGFFVVVGYKVRQMWKKSKAPDAILVGLSAGTLVYAISFQSTDGTILAFCWIHLGLLASAVILYSNRTEPETQAVSLS